MSAPRTAETDWKSLPHELPDEMHKYLMMLTEACGAENELKLLTRFQKTLRLIHDRHTEALRTFGDEQIEKCAQVVMDDTILHVDDKRDLATVVRALKSKAWL
jgi:hypothetical protein